MTLPTLQLEPDEKSQKRSRAFESIGEMLGTYNKQKEGERLADLIGIPKDKRSDFASLPPEWQKIYATMVQKEKGEKKKLDLESEKIPQRSAKFLKEFYPSLADDPEAKRSIAELAKQKFSEGMSENQAYDAAIQGFKDKGSPQQGLSDEPSSAGKEEGFRDFFSKILSESQSKQPGEHPIHVLEKEKPGGTLAALGLGAVSPIEELVRYQSKAGRDVFKKMGFTYPDEGKPPELLTEKARKKLHEGLSPEAKKSAKFGELAGAFLPVERLLTGLKVIGKSNSFLKNAEKVAAREGISAEKAAQKIAQEAEKAGVNLEKVAAGDKKEAAKFHNLSNRISKGAPESGTELRMQRAKPKEKMFKTEERIKTRTEQLKAHPKYKAEIEADAAARAARAEAKIPKTARGEAGLKARKATAESNIPTAEKGYRNSLARVRALEDQIAKVKGPAKERYKELLDAAKSEQRDAESFLKQTLKNAERGESREGFENMRKAAQKKLTDITDKIAEGQEIKLAKMDYNPERIKEAKRIRKKKAVPGKKKEDFYDQVHGEYENVYRKRLASVEDQLKKSGKSLADAQNKRRLHQEKEVLKKLIEHTEADRTIHNHQLALRQTEETHKAAQRFGKLQKAEGKPKVQKVAKEKIQEAVRNPSGKAAEELAAEGGFQKENLTEAKSEFKNAWEKFKKGTKTSKKVPPSGTNLMKEIRRTMRNIEKKRFSHIFLKTPLGREILFSLAVSTANDVFGLKINPFLTAAVGRRTAMYPIRAAVTQIYQAINPKKQIVKRQYLNAIKAHDDKTVAKIRKEHASWAKEARKELAG